MPTSPTSPQRSQSTAIIPTQQQSMTKRSDRYSAEAAAVLGLKKGSQPFRAAPFAMGLTDQTQYFMLVGETEHYMSLPRIKAAYPNLIDDFEKIQDMLDKGYTDTFGHRELDHGISNDNPFWVFSGYDFHGTYALVMPREQQVCLIDRNEPEVNGKVIHIASKEDFNRITDALGRGRTEEEIKVYQPLVDDLAELSRQPGTLVPWYPGTLVTTIPLSEQKGYNCTHINAKGCLYASMLYLRGCLTPAASPKDTEWQQIRAFHKDFTNSMRERKINKLITGLKYPERRDRALQLLSMFVLDKQRSENPGRQAQIERVERAIHPILLADAREHRQQMLAGNSKSTANKVVLEKQTTVELIEDCYSRGLPNVRAFKTSTPKPPPPAKQPPSETCHQCCMDWRAFFQGLRGNNNTASAEAIPSTISPVSTQR